MHEKSVTSSSLHFRYKYQRGSIKIMQFAVQISFTKLIQSEYDWKLISFLPFRNRIFFPLVLDYQALANILLFQSAQRAHPSSLDVCLCFRFSVSQKKIRLALFGIIKPSSNFYFCNSANLNLGHLWYSRRPKGRGKKKEFWSYVRDCFLLSSDEFSRQYGRDPCARKVWKQEVLAVTAWL